MNKFLITYDIKDARDYRDTLSKNIEDILKISGEVRKLATSTTLLFETYYFMEASEIVALIKKLVEAFKKKLVETFKKELAEALTEEDLSMHIKVNISVNVVRISGKKDKDYSLELA